MPDISLNSYLYPTPDPRMHKTRYKKPWDTPPLPPLTVKISDIDLGEHELNYDSYHMVYTMQYRGHRYRMNEKDLAEGVFRLSGHYSNYFEERNNDDMFASRKDEEDNTIRLCIRRGRVIKSTVIEGTPKSITFRNASVAKQCSDELNEKYFDTYDTYMDRDNNLRTPGRLPPEDLRKGMIEVISKYATLEDEVVGSTGN